MNDATSTCAKVHVHASFSALLTSYVQDLVAKGYHRLGSGNFAVVFQHPTFTNVVVRVADSEDVGNEWLALCHKQPFNPWLPQVADIQKATVTKGKQQPKSIQISFVEKTSALSLSLLPAGQRSLPTMLSLYEGAALPASTMLRKQLMGHLDRYVPKDRYARKAFALVLQGSAHSKVYWDLSPTNLRVRGPQLVINDPWWKHIKHPSS